ncbi:MAG TPA: hypothetical protein VGL81_33285 [Polyangiaceae bacterium]|jgi:hypothetical protein
MQQSNRVRTYLDPDAVGPLPRSSLADDSDALAAARTILRVPGTSTVEISADDVIEVVDPNRPVRSLAPVGFDTAIVLPRRRLGWVVVGAIGLAVGVLLLAVVQSPAAPPVQASAAVPAARPAEPLPQAAVATAATPTPASTVGTLRLDSSIEGQRVFVDGVALRAPAALVRCGPHEVAMGSLERVRTIDVPCGGEVTVFR